jgi:drug/metabolite transporter (DMT)-like permease
MDLRGIFWLIFSGFSFSVMSLFFKNLSQTLSVSELVFYRSFSNFLFFFPVMLYRKDPLFPSGKRVLVIRSLAGLGGLACYIYALSVLPLSVAAMLNWSSPIFVIIFSSIFLKEKTHRQVLLWVLVSLIGLVLILRPDPQLQAVALPLSGILIGVLGSAFAGIAYTAVRAASSRVSVYTIIVYFTALSTLISTPFFLKNFQNLDVSQMKGVLGMAVFAALGQLGLTQGFRLLKAGVASALGLNTVLFASLWGGWFFDETLDWVQWVGMGLLGLGIVLTGLKARAKPSLKLPDA